MKKFKCAVHAGNMPREEHIEKYEKGMDFSLTGLRKWSTVEHILNNRLLYSKK